MKPALEETLTRAREGVPVAVNWTVTTHCNYHCKYCFARFPELQGRSPLSFGEMKVIPPLLAEAGCEKITFVGGEPLLYPRLQELIRLSHDCGMTTMLGSNGSLLTPDFLKMVKGTLDWCFLSIDSACEATQGAMGRGTGDHVRQTLQRAELLQDFNIGLKINTVVTSYNLAEDMSAFIQLLSPQRWKVFQFLPVLNQNDAFAAELSISSEEFDNFARRHRHLPYARFETNKDMRGSYLMLSPHGEFFSNANGGHEYYGSILRDGLQNVLRRLPWDAGKFCERGGVYLWARHLEPCYN